MTSPLPAPAPMTASAAAGAIDARKTYGVGDAAVHALDGITISFEPAKFTAIMGPSGSGKSTLLHCLAGLDALTHGAVFIGDTHLASLSDKQLTELRRRSVGFVFQAYNLIPVLTARENVEFVMQVQGMASAERGQKALEILEEVGLKGLEDRRPGEMSGGQQQRVAVARAIVSEPSLVLADEPTANLDSHSADDLMALFTHLNEQHGTTFVIATHDQRVMAYAKRLVRMLDGRIVEDIRQDVA